MKNVLFLTNGIHNRSNGRYIASYGYCKEFSKYVNLKTISSIPYNIDIDKAKKDIEVDFDIQLCQEDKYTLLNMAPRMFEFLMHKADGVIEISKPHTYHAAEQYIKNNKVDVIIIDHIGLARFFFYLKKRFPDIVYVYNSHNVEGINFYQSITGKTFPLDSPEELSFESYFDKCKYRRFADIERRMLNETDYTIAISKGDLTILHQLYGIPDNKLLLTKPLTRFKKIKEKHDLKEFHKKLLIVGSMNWYPNVRGIIWFIDNVFSEIVSSDSEYSLYIVGRDPVPELVDKAKEYPDNIVLTGSVESTEPYFDQCDISIVPVFEGTGIKIKVIESFARGIPTICSGYAAKDYENVGQMSVASDKEAWISHINKLKDSFELREKYYRNMESYCESYYALTEDMRKLFGINS